MVQLYRALHAQDEKFLLSICLMPSFSYHHIICAAQHSTCFNLSSIQFVPHLAHCLKLPLLFQ
uniref:Uncharacterized protein n=1 Tax=Triticum urartu TaxID=4572 RepID=A0A8R7V6P5_TRIUA